MEKGNLSQQTADRLYAMIVVEKRIAVGEKLPNEVNLSQELGVGRTTLREAIRTLAAQGVLQVQRGKGTFVSPQVNEINDFGFSDFTRMQGQLRDLFELRRIVEPSAARLACQRASEEELAEILHWGSLVADCIQSGNDRTEADRAFHSAIVRATHNEFLMRLLPMIHQAVEGAIVTSDQPTLAEDTLRDHGLIMDFMKNRDADGAEHAMAIHMQHSIRSMHLAP